MIVIVASWGFTHFHSLWEFRICSAHTGWRKSNVIEPRSVCPAEYLHSRVEASAFIMASKAKGSCARLVSQFPYCRILLWGAGFVVHVPQMVLAHIIIDVVFNELFLVR